MAGVVALDTDADQNGTQVMIFDPFDSTKTSVLVSIPFFAPSWGMVASDPDKKLMVFSGQNGTYGPDFNRTLVAVDLRTGVTHLAKIPMLPGNRDPCFFMAMVFYQGTLYGVTCPGGDYTPYVFGKIDFSGNTTRFAPIFEFPEQYVDVDVTAVIVDGVYYINVSNFTENYHFFYGIDVGTGRVVLKTDPGIDLDPTSMWWSPANNSFFALDFDHESVGSPPPIRVCVVSIPKSLSNETNVAGGCIDNTNQILELFVAKYPNYYFCLGFPDGQAKKGKKGGKKGKRQDFPGPVNMFVFNVQTATVVPALAPTWLLGWTILED